MSPAAKAAWNHRARQDAIRVLRSAANDLRDEGHRLAKTVLPSPNADIEASLLQSAQDRGKKAMRLAMVASWLAKQDITDA